MQGGVNARGKAGAVEGGCAEGCEDEVYVCHHILHRTAGWYAHRKRDVTAVERDRVLLQHAYIVAIVIVKIVDYIGSFRTFITNNAAILFLKSKKITNTIIIIIGL